MVSEKNLQNWTETHSIWHRITGEADQQLPDSDTTVLVYDEDLADTVMASLNFVMGEGNDVDHFYWLDVATDQRLPNPIWWADVPFPEDI